VNHRVCDRTDEASYATLFYAIIQPNGAVEYFNAGHVPAFVRKKSGDLVALEAQNFPIGMFDFAEYTAGTCQLDPGDYLVMYSDGVTEAANLNEELFGEDRLREVLKNFKGDGAQQLLENVLAAVRAFTAGYAQADDITVVTLRYQGQQQPA
jgi:sigma-B regulation protein RsbU (phosphoserine phosphatase)